MLLKDLTISFYHVHSDESDITYSINKNVNEIKEYLSQITDRQVPDELANSIYVICNYPHKQCGSDCVKPEMISKEYGFPFPEVEVYTHKFHGENNAEIYVRYMGKTYAKKVKNVSVERDLYIAQTEFIYDNFVDYNAIWTFTFEDNTQLKLHQEKYGATINDVCEVDMYHNMNWTGKALDVYNYLYALDKVNRWKYITNFYKKYIIFKHELKTINVTNDVHQEHLINFLTAGELPMTFNILYSLYHEDINKTTRWKMNGLCKIFSLIKNINTWEDLIEVIHPKEKERVFSLFFNMQT